MTPSRNYSQSTPPTGGVLWEEIPFFLDFTLNYNCGRVEFLFPEHMFFVLRRTIQHIVLAEN